jgi:hypothetical protein
MQVGADERDDDQGSALADSSCSAMIATDGWLRLATIIADQVRGPSETLTLQFLPKQSLGLIGLRPWK